MSTAVFTADVLRRLDTDGRRDTSCPTADRFHQSYTGVHHDHALARRDATPPLAVDAHLPFCESACCYSACNKAVTRRHERAAECLDALEREIALHERALGLAFELAPDAECSSEVAPRTAAPDRLQDLAALGLNRLSFGAQDFDPEVQQAAHREQPFERVEASMRCARHIGFTSIDIDPIYGLPKQQPENVARAIARVVALAPERFKPQRRIVSAELPDGAARLASLGHAIATYDAAGYDYIGGDRFACPDGALAVAKREGPACTATSRATRRSLNAICSASVSRPSDARRVLPRDPTRSIRHRARP